MAAAEQPKVAWLIRMRVKFEDQDAENVAEEDQIHLQDNDDIVDIVVFPPTSPITVKNIKTGENINLNVTRTKIENKQEIMF